MKTRAGFQGKGKGVASVKFRERFDNDADVFFLSFAVFCLKCVGKGGRGFSSKFNISI